VLFSCGTLELLFPNQNADDYKTRWLPTEQDHQAFSECGFAAPAQAERDLLRNARFVDDGVILFSPDRRESTAIQTFVFVRLMPGQQTRMTSLGVCEALRRMQQSSLQMSRYPSLSDGDAILETLSNAVRVELVIGSLDEAVQQVLALLPQSAQGQAAPAIF
jgi:hypothetical protein